MSENVNVVLVHGAWADGSSWAKVIGPLAAEGIRVLAAPLPLTSLLRIRRPLSARWSAFRGSSFLRVTHTLGPQSRLHRTRK
jgi:hypothetical protein